MAMTRWAPFRDLISVREAMDKLFEESLVPPAFLAMEHKHFPVDLFETTDVFTLKASLPGIDPAKISVQATPDIVTIKGEIEEEKKDEKTGTVVRQELRYGLFERTVELPMTIDPTKVDAKYAHGILTLTLPKSEVVKPKLIPVKVI